MHKFHTHSIICLGEAVNWRRHLQLKMIIDTGSTYTIISSKAAARIACDASRKIKIITGGKTMQVPVVIIPTFRALGFTVRKFRVLVHDLPSRRNIDGLLGLDFLKKSKAIIDFSQKEVRTKKQMLR